MGGSMIKIAKNVGAKGSQSSTSASNVTIKGR